jgi:hypothetical protein
VAKIVLVFNVGALNGNIKLVAFGAEQILQPDFFINESPINLKKTKRVLGLYLTANFMVER